MDAKESAGVNPMRVECRIVEGKVTIPKQWLEEYETRFGSKPDTAVFDLSDASPQVPAGVWIYRKGDNYENH